MKSVISAAAVASLLVLTVPAFAQSTTAPPPAKSSARTPAKAGTSTSATAHATKGVIKSVDASKLVLSRAKGKPDRTFVLNESTTRHGTLAVGTTVDVRYRTEGSQRVATAITVHQTKSPAAAKSKAAK